MHAALAELLGVIGVTVLVRVAQHEHAAGLAALVEHADDDVAVLAHDEMARETRRCRRRPSRRIRAGA